MEQETTTSSKALFDLFTSRVRIKILSIFLLHPDEMYYVRQVTRMTEEEVNAVRRELERLKEINFLSTEERGNRLYYKARKDFIFYYELLRIMGKNTGLGKKVLEQAHLLGKIKYITISLKFLQNKPAGPNDIDVLFVGQLQIDRLQSLVREYESSIGHEINYTVMTEDEFDFRKNRGDAFIRSVLSQPHLVLIGDEEALHEE